jgi:tryptophan synthase alpha chain
LNRIDLKFKELRGRKQKAFIVFITAGYPDLKVTEELILRFAGAGVDIIELGVPFTDPMADGPVIQHASCQALKNNTRLLDILNLVKKVRNKVSIPITLMTYYNPIFSFGQDKFIKDSLSAGVDGIIIPDLPVDEGKEFILRANRAGLYNICFISPTTSLQRMKFILKFAKGFIYYVSLTGVTGMRRDLPKDVKANISRIKKYTALPVCAGFGISNRLQAKELAAFSDGVIIGSAIVAKIKENIKSRHLVRKITSFVGGLNIK